MQSHMEYVMFGCHLLLKYRVVLQVTRNDEPIEDLLCAIKFITSSDRQECIWCLVLDWKREAKRSAVRFNGSRNNF